MSIRESGLSKMSFLQEVPLAFLNLFCWQPVFQECTLLTEESCFSDYEGVTIRRRPDSDFCAFEAGSCLAVERRLPSFKDFLVFFTGRSVSITIFVSILLLYCGY
jgi:hypothetical protein